MKGTEVYPVTIKRLWGHKLMGVGEKKRKKREKFFKDNSMDRYCVVKAGFCSRKAMMDIK